MKFILLFIIFTASLFSNENISLQLHWKHQFQFAGYYMAKEKGFYNDLGLDVNIKEYEYGIQPLDEVIKQNTEYGIGRSSLVIDISKGADIKMLLAAFQSSPQIFIASKDSNITTLKDFASKKIMITPDVSNTVSLRAIINKVGIKIEDMEILEHSFNVDDLSNSKTDLMVAYISNEPYILQEKGVEVNLFHPSDYGFDFYGDILFTSAYEMQKHPIRMLDFKNASLKGWKYSFDNIEETVNLILTKYNTQNKSKSALLFEAQELKKLAYYETETLGSIDKAKIQRIYDMYNVMGFVDKKIEIDEFVYIKDSIKFTDTEKNYLEQQTINMCVDPHWMPFEKIENEKHIGISADYFKMFKEKFGIDVRLVPTDTWSQSLEFAKQRKCDILSLTMATPIKKEYLNFTEPYLKIPLVIATKTDVPFINDFTSLEGKTVGIPKDYSFVEILKKQHPKLKIIEVENIKDGLDRVTQGELFGYIGALASIGHLFQNDYTGELKIAGKFDASWDLSVGVRNDDPILLNIFQKATKGIDTLSKQKIMNDWVAISYEKGTDYTLIIKILLAVCVVLAFLLYRHSILKTANKELELLATTDSMTKLHNRRYFSQATEYMLLLAKRNSTNISTLLLDIDSFKNVNDTYGHKIGDDVIITLASLLKEITRESDIVCRYGGEEFAILLPKTDVDGAQKIANKIRKKVEELTIDLEDSKTLNFTVSIGVSQVNTLKESSIEAVMSRADKALYEAKETGKNKVCVYTN